MEKKQSQIDTHYIMSLINLQNNFGYYFNE